MSGPATARFAFIDLLADGHWGGLMSGDQVQIDFGAFLGRNIVIRGTLSKSDSSFLIVANQVSLAP